MPARAAVVSTAPVVGARASLRWLEFSGSRAQVAFLSFLLFAAVVLANWPAVGGDWVWDDATAIRGNRFITQGSGLAHVWFSIQQPDYWPVSYSLLWLEWRIWGDDPIGYRLVNFLLHGINAVLVWQLCQRLRVPAAWLCGLFFAVHPLTVEAVNWIIQCKTLLATGFSLASMIVFLTAYDSRRVRPYIAALALFILAMLSKTSAVTIPIVLVILIAWRQRRLTRFDLGFVAPFFLVSLVLGAVGLWFQQSQAIGENIIRQDGALSRLALSAWAVWFYLGKALLPINLSFVYPLWKPAIANPLTWLPLVTLAALLVALWLLRKRIGLAPLVALGVYLATLLPVLGVVNIFFMRYSLVADHWQYPALPAVIALLVGLGGHWAARVRWARIALSLAAALACAALLLQSRARAEIFGAPTNETLWLDTLAKNPTSSMANNNLGALRIAQSRWAEAKQLLETSVRLLPNDVESRVNLARAYYTLGERQAARDQFAAALLLNRQSTAALTGLGQIAADLGEDAAAAKYHQDALAIDPHSADAMTGIGVIYGKRNEFAAAEEWFRRAAASDPRNASARVNLGLSLLKQERFAEAEHELRKSIELFPMMIEGRLLLSEALIRQGKVNAAIVSLTTASQLHPNSARLRQALGLALAMVGRRQEAVTYLRDALRINPNLPGAAEQLSNIQRALGTGARP
jgi:tetratricopeptide (TPR) repeat protein